MTTPKRGRKSWGALLAVAALRDGVALRQPISRKGPTINDVRTEEGRRRDGPKADNIVDKFCECHCDKGSKIPSILQTSFLDGPKAYRFLFPWLRMRFSNM